ncbi:hypothetical protein GZ77_06845 [Endozoicomonas montiporae]|uniref:Uncharacterized protein n=2 Tax=Endozoicomonas montiporae TaxID=1027273 RepID=A0A081N6T7_9GAMM|nr:hypothetical protein [Endozoicomonas montiporae]AMO56498.1 hypothetical protein EZMO1_2403 [Endozoicomonas montiporae CL-33]KEQ14160.1 hypothetical protein GZ77_06845 [Endozoicomonas montiporae]
MGTLNVGGHFANTEEMDIIEQQRLAALIEITEQHTKEVTQLKSRLDAAEQKAEKLDKLVKSSENELKNLRASNPDRLKKQVKRLQEQNRGLTGENNTLKSKQKQLTQQLNSSKQEVEQLQAELKDKEEKSSED